MPDLAPYQMSDRELAQGSWRGTPAFLAESELVLRTASECGAEVLSMLSTPAFAFPDIPCACRELVSAQEFRQITGYPQTRSAVGICRRPCNPGWLELAERSRRLLVIEDSTSGVNMATLFRIAWAFGIDGVLLSPSCADPLFRRAARMSRGSVLRVPWARIPGPREWAPQGAPQLQELGYALAALALSEDSVSLQQLPHPPKLALVLGTEGEGLRQQTIASCDLTVKIPMRPGVDSLNVAAAAAVACWEATR
ncbi:MAG: TrmH family RNA methyltransferase [Coriobacteriales bacterium]